MDLQSQKGAPVGMCFTDLACVILKRAILVRFPNAQVRTAWVADPIVFLQLLTKYSQQLRKSSKQKMTPFL